MFIVLAFAKIALPLSTRIAPGVNIRRIIRIAIVAIFVSIMLVATSVGGGLALAEGQVASPGGRSVREAAPPGSDFKAWPNPRVLGIPVVA